jgi:hypothetical protein
LNEDRVKNVLLIFPSSLSLNRKTKLIDVVKKKLLLSNIKVNKITIEEGCIAFEVTDVIEAAAVTVELFGICQVAVAKCIPNRFTDVVATIVKTGKQIILPEEKCFIRVRTSSKAKISYIGRDVEFASSGNLIAELSRIASKPAKNEHEANKVILSYIGKHSAYVCLQIDTALGGIPSGSQKEKLVCGIHNILSSLSCMMAVKCGFIPDFLIMYTNEDDLKENAKLFGFIAPKMSVKKYRIRLIHIDLPDKYNHHLKLMLQEGISIRILTLLPGKGGLVIPLSAAIHPPWFVESTVKKIVSTGKMPWMPLMLLTDGIYHDANGLGLEDKITSIDDLITTNMIMFKKQEYKKYERKIEMLSKAAVKNMKTISLKVGSNYLHDIIDSI